MYITAEGQKIKTQPNCFYVTESEISNWSLIEEIEKLDLVYRNLIDSIPLKFFSSLDEYLKKINSSPAILLDTGISPESSLSKKVFEQFLNSIDAKQKKDYYNILYTEDIRDRLGFLHNKMRDIKNLTILFYIQLSKIPNPYRYTFKNDIYFLCGIEVESSFALLESVFQKMHSSLDLCVKLVHTINFSPIDYQKYHKIKFNNICWSDRKKYDQTYDFSPITNNKHLKTIESLRNEFTHNGSWECSRKVYVQTNMSIEKKRWIMLNDHINGIPSTCINRTRFYSNETHINTELPFILSSFFISITDFLELLNNKITV